MAGAIFAEHPDVKNLNLEQALISDLVVVWRVLQ